MLICCILVVLHKVSMLFFVTLENDELKLNNIFYKLGHHDTELKSISNSMSRILTTGRKTETKLNKHAFNVEYLHRQLKEMQLKLTEKEEEKMKVLSLQKTVDHLEDRLSETLYRLANVENSTKDPKESLHNSVTHGRSIDFVGHHNSLLQFPLRDQGACSEGWQLLEGFCFFVSEEKKNFKDAVASCASRGAYLLSLTEAKRDIFLRKIISTAPRYWTSGTDVFSHNQWSFLMSGDSIPREMWSKPLAGYLTSIKSEHCAVLANKGLESVKCGRRFPFICELL